MQRKLGRIGKIESLAKQLDRHARHIGFGRTAVRLGLVTAGAALLAPSSKAKSWVVGGSVAVAGAGAGAIVIKSEKLFSTLQNFIGRPRLALAVASKVKDNDVKSALRLLGAWKTLTETQKEALRKYFFKNERSALEKNTLKKLFEKFGVQWKVF